MSLPIWIRYLKQQKRSREIYTVAAATRTIMDDGYVRRNYMPPVAPEEVNKALDPMQSGKAAGRDQITVDFLNDGGRYL